MLDTDAVIAELAKKSTITARIGRYVGAQDGQALIDMGDQRFPAFFLTGTVPQINEPVHVWSVDGTMFMVGATTPKPGIGVIVTITSGTRVEVQTDFGNFTMPIAPSSATPTSGDTVGISWSSQPWCTLLVDVPDAPEPPPAPGGGSGAVQSAEFRAIDAGSTDRDRIRWWTPQPWASSSTYGAWFYGSKVKDTIPAGATLVYENGQPQIFFRVRKMAQNAGGTPRFALHASPTKAGVPVFGAYSEWNPPDGWQVPPDPQGWFDSLKAGGPSYGVGLNQGGWSQYASLAEDGMSGALFIKWRT